jgi:AcrR family transcriptional regulator
MAGVWLREEQADLAADKILDAAAKAFIERGVSRAGMRDIAEYAGCSRGTLYRYFENRHELHRAYINRWAEKLAARVRADLTPIEDPRERLVEGIVRSLHEVRSTPAMAVWFEEGDSGLAAHASRGAEVVDEVAATFVARLLGGEGGAASRLRARWLVRVVVSLLTLPGENEAEEREVIDRFVAPGLLSGGDS